MINRWIAILRGIAILGVIIFHTSVVLNSELEKEQIPKSNIVSYIAGLGRFGPYVFFFISGVLLSSNYRKNSIGSTRRKIFWRRRLAKIAPLWVLFISIVVLEVPLARDRNLSEAWGSSQRSNILTLVLAIFFVTFLSSDTWSKLPPGGWSIASEMYAYVFFSWTIEKSIMSILRVVMWIMFIDSVLSVGQTIWESLPIISGIIEIYLRVHLASILMFFVTGMCCHMYLGNKGSTETKDFLFNWRTLSTNLIGIFLLSLFGQNLHGTNLEALSVLVICSLIAYSLMETSHVAHFISWMGRHSYALYFAHFQIIFFFNIYRIPSLTIRLLDNLSGSFLARNLALPILLAGVITSSLILGILINRLYESPINRLLRGKPIIED